MTLLKDFQEKDIIQILKVPVSYDPLEFMFLPPFFISKRFYIVLWNRNNTLQIFSVPRLFPGGIL